MSDCVSCQQILAGESPGGLKCMLKRYRKLIIGFVAGAVLVFVLMKIRGKK